MATTAWTGGGTAGDGTDNNNWSGSAPANSDIAVIAATGDSITSMPAALTGVTWRFGPGFSGTLGTSASWIDLGTGATMDFNSGGTSHYVTGTFTTVRVSGGVNSANMLNFKANASSDIGTLQVLGGSGTITIGSNAVLDDLEVVNASAITILIDDSVTSLDNVTVEAGKVTCKAAVATKATARGVKLTIDGTGATVAELVVTPGGIVRHKSGAVITTLEVGGLFDGRDNNSGSVTVTNCTLLEGGVLDVRNGLANYVFTNNITYQGGVAYPPLGSTLTIS